MDNEHQTGNALAVRLNRLRIAAHGQDAGLYTTRIGWTAQIVVPENLAPHYVSVSATGSTEERALDALAVAVADVAGANVGEDEL